MLATDRSVSALGLALIALAGTTAGFLAGSVPSADGSPGVDRLEPGEARRIAPAPDQLELTAAGPGPVLVVLFDGNGTYLRSLHLEADTDEHALDLQPTEPRILLLPQASAPVEIGLPAGSDAETTPVATRESPRRLLTQSADTIDEEISLTIPNRPASLGLELDGSAEGLDVTVRTSEGPALRQTGTPDEPEARSLRLEPAFLTNGTYRVSIEADRLEGSLTLVTRTLAVNEELEALEAPSEEVARLGALVARIQEGQAWQIPTEEADELLLAVEEGAWADVRIYSSRDRLVRQIEVGQEGPAWRWSDNGSSQPSYEAVSLDVRQDTFTLYAEQIQAQADATVYAVLADHEEARPGWPVDVESRVVQVPYPSPAGATEPETVRYAGGLVDVRLETAEGAAVDRRVTVDSSAGVVFDRHDRSSTGDVGVVTSQVKHVERFGPGPLEVQLEADAASGSLTLVVDHYAP